MDHDPSFPRTLEGADDARRSFAAPEPARRDWLKDTGLAQLPLRWRFRLIVLLFAIPFLFYVVLTAVEQQSMERQHISVESRDAATLLAARFEDHIDQIDRTLATAAQVIGGSVGDAAAVDALFQNMRSVLPKSVDNLAVWGLDGRSIAALDRRTRSRSVDVSDRRYFKDALKARELVFEGPILSRSTGTMIVQFARPVMDRESRVVAVISMAMRPNELVGVLDPAGAVSESSIVSVLDEEGTIVARSVDPETWVGKSLPSVDSVRRMFARRVGWLEDVGADGQHRLSGFATVGKWPWAVAVSQSTDKLVLATGERLLRHLAIGLGIFIVAYLVAGRIAVSTTRPLMQLADDTERLQRGDLAHRSTVASGGEIATLAQHFNRMAHALEERDAELAKSRERLRAITDNVPAQICYIDHEERYRFVNAFAGDLPGLESEDILGRTVHEARGDALYAVLGPHVRRALAGEATAVDAERVVDGRTFHEHYAYVPDRGRDGRIRGVYGFAQDITERKVAEWLRGESERRLVTITDNLPAMICYVDEDRRFRFANRTFEKWFDKPLDEIVGQPFDRLMPPELASKYEIHFLQSMAGKSLEYEVDFATGDGTQRWLRCSFIPDVDPANGTTRGVYGMIHNVTKAKEAEQRLTRLAQFDTLTGIPNRHQFNETLAHALAAGRDASRPIALMFLDIDHFKQVNDRYGHACGDVLLKEFAQRLADSVRPTDAVARLSGDEFVVLLEGLHSDEEPQFIARKIIAAVEKPFRLDAYLVRVTTSIGIAMGDEEYETSSALMKRADEALYDAKRAGRNTFRLAV